MNPCPLLRRVQIAIHQNPYANQLRVFIERLDGDIILRGRVDSFFQKQMIQEGLRKLDGIGRIFNQLEVRSQSVVRTR